MATVIARPLELDLLCQKLDADYANRITGTGNTPESRRSNYLSKAIAAFVLHEDAGANLDEAVAASIDGGQDHGIDSVFVSTDQTIWLVQSKYKESGTGEPELGDVSKFRDGVTDLLQGRWNRFNNALQNRQAAITNALNSGVCRIKVVLAYSGTAVSDDRRDIFADLERAFNGANPDCSRNQRRHHVIHIGFELGMLQTRLAQLQGELEEADVSSISKMRTMLGIAARHADLTKRQHEVIQAPLGNALHHWLHHWMIKCLEQLGIDDVRAHFMGNAAEQLAHAQARISDGFQLGKYFVQLDLLPALQCGTQEGVARGEVPVEAALGDAEPARQRLHRDGGDALLRDLLERLAGPVVGAQAAAARGALGHRGIRSIRYRVGQYAEFLLFSARSHSCRTRHTSPYGK